MVIKMLHSIPSPEALNANCNLGWTLYLTIEGDFRHAEK